MDVPSEKIDTKPYLNSSNSSDESISESDLSDNISTSCEYISVSECAPLHTDETAIDDRNIHNCKNRITIKDAESGTVSRPVRIYSDGVYDLFHHGHAKQLQQVKNMFPKCLVYLIVGVHSDSVVQHMKGPTLMTETERYESVRHCRYADCVIDNAPWIINEEFIQDHKIDFVAHDNVPYPSGNEKDVYAYLKERGMFVATKRTKGVSTSDIITRVVNNYDSYVKRNLERGYTRKDLNYGHIREQLLKLSGLVEYLIDIIW